MSTLSPSDDLVRRVAEAVATRLGRASPEVIETVVAEVLRAVTASADASPRPTIRPLEEPTGPRPFAGGLRPFSLSPALELPTRALDHCALCREHEARAQRRAVCTTTGKNRTGIVATITRVIAEAGGDILDIAQTIVADFFTMIIVLDVTGLERNGCTFSDLRDRLVQASEELGVHSVVMHEDVMKALQRV